MLQADSCCKSSHSWREAGSPRLICLTSNITNHLGPGNISFSSSLCLFSSLSVFAACLTVTSSPPVSYPWSFSSASLLVSYMCLSGGKTSGGWGAERRGCFVSRFMPTGHHGSNDDNEMRGRVPLSRLSSHFLSSVFSSFAVTHAPRLFQPIRIWAPAEIFICSCCRRWSIFGKMGTLRHLADRPFPSLSGSTMWAGAGWILELLCEQHVKHYKNLKNLSSHSHRNKHKCCVYSHEMFCQASTAVTFSCCAFWVSLPPVWCLITEKHALRSNDLKQRISLPCLLSSAVFGWSWAESIAQFILLLLSAVTLSIKWPSSTGSHTRLCHNTTSTVLDRWCALGCFWFKVTLVLSYCYEI